MSLSIRNVSDSDEERVENLFSETEKEVIEYLVEHPEMSYSDIADERGVTRGAVNNAVARIRDKSRTAIITLLDSPHTKEVAKELDDRELETLISLLEEATNN
jgi:DNA-binding CsgD family transcriptional regulator